MPEGFWVNRAVEEIEKFLAHNIVRQHLSTEARSLLYAERERLIDLFLSLPDHEQRW
jgi:hypothetical protein